MKKNTKVDHNIPDTCLNIPISSSVNAVSDDMCKMVVSVDIIRLGVIAKMKIFTTY